MERYTIINTGTQKEWLPYCPVKVIKFNILFDNIDKTNVLQVKYKNISNKTIKSIWIGVNGFDDAMDNTVSRSDIAYMNVNSSENDFFGSDMPISLNSSTTSKVIIIIEKVVFNDDTVWRNENRKTGILLPQAYAKDLYGELYDQYCIETRKLNLSNQYAFIDMKDYWVCPCGQGNLKEYTVCCNCHTLYGKLKEISDSVYLSNKKTNRLKIEAELERKRAEAAEEERKKQIEKEEADRIAAIKLAERIEKEKAQRHKKIVKISTILISGTLLIAISVFLFHNIPKMSKYISANNAVKNEEYDTAIDYYTELGDFLSSENKITETKYLKAEKLIENNTTEDLNTAITIFTKIADYKDSQEKIKTAKYNLASLLSSDNQLTSLSKAVELYSGIIGFNDSQQQFNEKSYILANMYTSEGTEYSLKEAAHLYSKLNNYEDSSQKLVETYYALAAVEYNSGNYTSALSHYKLCGDYSNSQAMVVSSQNQETLTKAANAYNNGDYKLAIQTASTIPGVTSAKQDVASANEISEWSKKKIYDDAVSGKMKHEEMINNLEFLINYNYKDCSTKLSNIKYRYQQISGTYIHNSYGYIDTWKISADYKTNYVSAIHTSSSGKTYNFSGPLKSTGGTLGSLEYSSDVKFYQGYMTDYLDYRYTKVS